MLDLYMLGHPAAPGLRGGPCFHSSAGRISSCCPASAHCGHLPLEKGLKENEFASGDLRLRGGLAEPCQCAFGVK